MTTPVKDWLNELAIIYRDIWELEPKVYWDARDETYHGTFFDFVRAAGEPVGVSQDEIIEAFREGGEFSVGEPKMWGHA